MADLGAKEQALSQTPDGTWVSRKPIVWAPKRGFLQDWQNYTIHYYSSPMGTVVTQGVNELHRFDQWVTLDRLTKLLCFS